MAGTLPATAMSTALNYPKCRTCRHLLCWEETREVGECLQITSLNEIAFLPTADIDQVMVRMNPDKFGCSLHSELETDQQKGEG